MNSLTFFLFLLFLLDKICKLGGLGKDTSDTYPYLGGFSEVSCLSRMNDDIKKVLAGYTDGTIRIYDTLSKKLVASLKGHRSSVQCLKVSDSTQESSNSTYLASGGSDCDILIWDLITFSGLIRLRGHKGPITGLEFLIISDSSSHRKSSSNMIVSTSKDTLLKV